MKCTENTSLERPLFPFPNSDRNPPDYCQYSLSNKHAPECMIHYIEYASKSGAVDVYELFTPDRLMNERNSALQYGRFTSL